LTSVFRLKMTDSDRVHSYYVPGGVPITPQARQFGFEFPVWVSKTVWRFACTTQGIKQARRTNLDQRIFELLQYCYAGMARKLAGGDDDFLWYNFKIWYWARNQPHSKKKKRARLAARLFLDPTTDGPWMYIFSPDDDSIDTLEKGEAPDVDKGRGELQEVGNPVDFEQSAGRNDEIFYGRTDPGHDDAVPDAETSKNLPR